ncbi:MAG: magnesium transporter CorA family protein [Sphingomonas sp.]|nr:magnesium transporter CorA family protein [Sphingomonas sp.]
MLRAFPSPEPGSAAAGASELPRQATWIDLLRPTREEEALVEGALNLAVPTREDMVEIEPSSRLYEEDAVLHLTASVLSGVHEGEPATVPVTFLLTKDRLVTVRYDDPKSFMAFVAHLERQPDLCHSAASTLVFLLDAIVERAADVLEEVALQTDRLKNDIFRRKTGSDRKRITNQALEDLMLEIGRAEGALSKVRESLSSLTRLISYLLFALPKYDRAEVSHLKTVARDVTSLTDMAAFMSSNITFLLDAALGLINIQQNAIIKIFSVAAVIFLPPTLVGTVYGMNFDHMPELHWLLGYPFALVLMLLSAILPYLWFKKKGWL